MIKLYVCKICGEPYLGGDAPHDCPFCGAPKRYLKSIEEYSELWKSKTSEQEKKDLQKTLDLEINASAYYDKVAKANKKYSKPNRLFKQLARVETEHAEIAARFLKLDFDKLELKGEDPKGSIEADLKRTNELEKYAIEIYEKFLKNAKNDNVKNLYVALIHAEKGHEEISEKELKSL